MQDQDAVCSCNRHGTRVQAVACATGKAYKAIQWDRIAGPAQTRAGSWLSPCAPAHGRNDGLILLQPVRRNQCRRGQAPQQQLHL